MYRGWYCECAGTGYYGKMCEQRKYYKGLYIYICIYICIYIYTYTGGGTVSVPGRGTTARCVNSVSVIIF